MSHWPEIVLIVLAYLLGAIPFGYIFTQKYTGQNILGLGSGNIGSTNVRRIAGRKVAAFTQICDMLKGLLPVTLVYFVVQTALYPFQEYFIYLVALATIIGHDFSVFLKFKGGKGVNTTLGASLLLAPYSVCASVVIYFAIKWKVKIVSVASIFLAIALTTTDLMIHRESYLSWYLLTASGLIVVRHIPNIRRLINGTENKL